jgi:hypothetical protein
MRSDKKFAPVGDTLSPEVTADNRFTKGGTSAPHSNSLINSTASLPPPGGVSFNAGVRTFTLTGGGTVTITLVGPGSANFDAGTSTLRLSNTTIASSVSIASSSGTLTNFDVISTDDASLAALAISATLAGDSDIAIDGAITTLSLGRVEGTGNVFVGGDITTLTIAALVGGFFEVRGVTTMTVTGAFGATNALTTGEASFSALSAGTIIISGRMQGLLSVDRDVAGVTLGAVDHGLIRIAGNVGPMTATSVRSSLIAARDSFGTVTVNGPASTQCVPKSAVAATPRNVTGAGFT